MRSRWIYGAAVVVTIGLGLGSRAIARELPWWLAKTAGDALYATMIFFGFAVIAPRARTSRLAFAALAWCVAVELAQLYQAPWIDHVRATLVGRLVLGQGFHAFDLACYAIGVAIAVAIDRAYHREPRRPLAADRARRRPRAASPRPRRQPAQAAGVPRAQPGWRRTDAGRRRAADHRGCRDRAATR